MCAWVDDHIVPLSPEYKTAIARLEQIEGLTVVRKLGGGGPKTGVYLVDVKTSTPAAIQGSWVVKVDVTWRARKEAEHQVAVRGGSLGKYVPILQDKALGGANNDLSALLYSLATGSFLNSQTLEKTVENNTQRPAQIVGEIARALLNEWNAECQHSTIDICQILQDNLRELSADPEGVQERLRTLLDVTKRRIEGEPLGDRWLVNPIPYLSGSVTAPKRPHCTVPLGHLHGDLHPGNIIVSVLSATARGDQPPFAIIDFALYRQGNVLFDLAYLEIAILWHLFEGFQSYVNRSSWWGLEQHLVSELIPLSTFDGVGRANDAKILLLPLRQQIQERARSVNRPDDYWVAYLIASVEAGLTLAYNPERIAKDPSMQPHLQLAAFLIAASRFHRILERFSISEELGIKQGESAPTQIVWPETARVSSHILKNPEMVAKFDELARDLMSPLRSGRCILIVGDRFAKEVLGVPLDGDLMREVAQKLKVDIPLHGGGKANIAALDWIDAQVSDKQRAVVDYLENLPKTVTAERCKDLSLVDWAAILDWSFSPTLHDRLAPLVPSSRPLRRIFCDGSADVDFHSPGFMPFIHFRGTIDEFKRLALGIVGLDQQQKIRREVLRALFQALPYKPVLLFVGFEKSTFNNHIRSDISEVLGPNANIWVVRSQFGPEDRMMLERSRGYKIAELSPEEFLEFCAYVGRPTPSETELGEEEYVLDIRGTERVEDESGRVYFRHSSDEGHVEQVPISIEDFRKIDRHLEVLHRQVLALEDETGQSPGDFYRGHIVLWKELAQELAIWRRRPAEGMMESILSDLADTESRRISLWYQPGAGATTLLRHLGFKLYFDHQIPVAFLRRHTRDTYGEVVRFYNCFRRSFVLLADEQDISRGDVDILFGRLQERRVPVVLIYAARSGQSKHQLKRAADERRRFYLVDELDPNERSELGQKLEPHLSRDQLRRFQQSKHESLFLTLLETFETSFVKVEDVVQGILESGDDSTVAVITNICFFWYYGHRRTPSSILEKISGLTAETLVAKLEPFEERLLWSESRQGQKIWFPRHDLLAEAVLAVTIGSSRPRGTRLKEYAIDLINNVSSGVEAADICQEMVWALVGTDREQALREELYIGGTGGRTLPSPLMRDIASIPGQEDVWKTVVTKFPDVPLFLAHYGRFLYGREVKRYPGAEEFLSRANTLAKGKDHTVLHMLGMRFRFELHDKLRERRDATDRETQKALSERIQFLAEQASQYFEQAVQTEPEDEHGYVSHIQMLYALVRDVVAQVRRSGVDGQEALLRADVQQWLQKAHDLVQAAETHVSLGNRSEYFIKAKGELYGLEGDLDRVINFYRSALTRLPSWQSGLVSESLARSLSRRAWESRIEKLPEQRWRSDFEEATGYLSAALRQDPYDTRRIALWFRCARFSGRITRSELIQRLEDLWREAKTLETAFDLSCLYFLEGLEYASVPDFERSEAFRAHSEARAPSGLVKRTLREWVGDSYALIPRAVVPAPEHYRPGEDLRKEFAGRIAHVPTEEEGKLTIEKTGGWEIWFQPHRPGRYYFTSADVGQSVRFIIGFSYDKPRAWLTKW